MLTHQDIPVIPWKELSLEQFKGSGSLGDVHQGTWQGKEVAIKLLQLKTLPAHLKKDFENELQILGQCQSPFVLGLYGICLEVDHCAVVMEYMSNGSLYHVLHHEMIPEQHRWQIAIDIAKGLAYLHSSQILHRDLKSQNILLDNNYRAKISDFDLAKLRLETSTMVGLVDASRSTAIRWRAPELCQPKAIATPASDVYSYGMILWELCTQKLPFEAAADEQTVIRWLNQGKKESIPENAPAVWRSIIEACWKNSHHRPTAEQIVAQLEAARPHVAETLVQKSWHVDTSSKPAVMEKSFALLKASKEDFQKVQRCYEHHPVPGYEIKSVEVIYNPTLHQSFALRMQLLQERQDSAAFKPKWSGFDLHLMFESDIPSDLELVRTRSPLLILNKNQKPIGLMVIDKKRKIEKINILPKDCPNDELEKFIHQYESSKKGFLEEDNLILKWLTSTAGHYWHEEYLWRKAVNQQWQALSVPYQDSDFPSVKLMPLWHGTKPEVLESLFRTGYANLATTDSGFFGKGIYSAHEAEYSYRVYSQGALILNWVAAYSAYPVIDGDMQKLKAKGNFGNYDAHFAPVIPKDPSKANETIYYPTVPQQKAQYHEMVVFESTQCLPQYLITLQESLSQSLGNLSLAETGSAIEQRPPSPTGEAYYDQGLQQEKQKNFLAAFQYYQKSANKGYAKAQTNLGNFYLTAPNQVVVQDKPKAFGYFLVAAKEGHIRAMSNLANMLEYGDGVKENKAEALTWYQKICAVEPNNGDAARKCKKLQAMVTSS